MVEKGDCSENAHRATRDTPVAAYCPHSATEKKPLMKALWAGDGRDAFHELDDSVTSSCIPAARGPAFHQLMHWSLDEPVMIPVRSHVAFRSRAGRLLAPVPEPPGYAWYVKPATWPVRFVMMACVALW
jgi:hypothetical protein